MFLEATKRLSSLVPEEALAQGFLFPHLKNIRVVSKEIAIEVCRVAFDQGLARVRPPANERALRSMVQEAMYWPKYQPLIDVSTAELLGQQL